MFNGRVPPLDIWRFLKRHPGDRSYDQVCCGSPLIRTGQTSFVEDLKKKNIEALPAGGQDRDDDLRRVRGDAEERLQDAVRGERRHGGPHRVRDRAPGSSISGRPTTTPATSSAARDPGAAAGTLARGRPGVRRDALAVLRGRRQRRSGGSGGGKALGAKRGEAVKATGADVVVTVCPFCEFHIADCTDVPVKNLVTIPA